jgi:hypothetical protein
VRITTPQGEIEGTLTGVVRDLGRVYLTPFKTEPNKAPRAQEILWTNVLAIEYL